MLQSDFDQHFFRFRDRHSRFQRHRRAGGNQRLRATGKPARKMLRQDAPFARQNHGPLHHVAQFPHVTRPVVPLQQLNRLRRHFCNPAAVLAVECGQLPLRQAANIPAPLAQRGQRNFKHGDAEIEIFPKRPVLNCRMQIPVRGNQNPHIQCDFADRSQPPHLALFQHAQQR